VANERRVRANNVQGTVSDNPLSSGATTLNSAGLANLPAIGATEHAILVLDPLRVAGAPEIVFVSAHTGAATSATVTRGYYGTSARSHNSGTLWVHAATLDDLIKICTSGTRPSTPYRGQLIFETDTNSFVGRDTSDAWQTAVPLGAWLSYTPTLTGGTSNPTLGTGNEATGTYTRRGRTIEGKAFIKFGTSGTAAGSGEYRISLPVTARTGTEDVLILGAAAIFDAATSILVGSLHITPASGAYARIYIESGSVVTEASPFAWGANMFMTVEFTYEASS